MSIPPLELGEIFEVVFATTEQRNQRTRKNWTIEELEDKAARINSNKRGGVKHARVENERLIVQTTDPRGLGAYTITTDVKR